MKGRSEGKKRAAAQWVTILLLSAPFLVMITRPAHAYLDSGATAMIAQFLIAAVVTLGVFIRRGIAAIKKLFLDLTGAAPPKE